MSRYRCRWCPAGASSDLGVDHHHGQVHDNAVVTAAGADHHDNFALYQFETLFPTGDPSQELFRANYLDR
jgi:hypothetical protein